jgi:branched-chain amino acid transport system permease protein
LQQIDPNPNPDGEEMLAQVIFAGLYMGCVYGLVGLGFVIIFNASKIFNFAQGEFLMLGSMFYVTFSVSLKLPFLLSLLFTIGCLAIVGFIMEATGINPLRKKNAEFMRLIMVTLAFGILSKNLAEIFWGKYPLRAPEIFETVNVSIAGQFFRVQGIAIIVGTFLGLFILWYFFKRTLFGKAFRASALNTEMAYLCGINVRSMVITSFVLGGALGGFAGVLAGPISQVYSHMGYMLGVKGFCAACIGGMGNLGGAVLAGVLIGLIENFVGAYFSTRLMHGLAFALLIVVLTFKPTGLLPTKEVLD